MLLGLGNSVNEVLGPFSKLNDPKWNLIHSVCERQPLNSESFGILHSAFCIHRAANNGRSTDNVRPDRGLDRSNSGLAGHFDRSFLDINILFSIELSLNAL